VFYGGPFLPLFFPCVVKNFWGLLNAKLKICWEWSGSSKMVLLKRAEAEQQASFKIGTQTSPRFMKTAK
jgi:hypothetical protein